MRVRRVSKHTWIVLGCIVTAAPAAAGTDNRDSPIGTNLRGITFATAERPFADDTKIGKRRRGKNQRKQWDQLETKAGPDEQPDKDTRRCLPADPTPTPSIFKTRFLDNLAQYRALRFVGWTRSTSLATSEWCGRARLRDPHWNTIHGVPAEVLIALANALNADPWFTFPVRVTDEYLREFASLARSRLKADLKVYIEFGNEVWNRSFPSTRWVLGQAKKAWPDAARQDPVRALRSWYGQRTVEMCRIWDLAWGPERDRLVCVLAAQAAKPKTAIDALECPLSQRAPCYNKGIDALAIAPYIGGYIGSAENQAAVQGWLDDEDGGLDRLFKEIFEGGMVKKGPPPGALAKAFRQMDNYVRLSEQYKLPMVAYEGGQHLVGRGKVKKNRGITSLFIRANRDPRMEEVYLRYLQGWKERAGELFMHFSSVSRYNKHGSWGALEDSRQETTPKYRALMKFMNENPCWWKNCG